MLTHADARATAHTVARSLFATMRATQAQADYDQFWAFVLNVGANDTKLFDAIMLDMQRIALRETSHKSTAPDAS